MLLFEEENYRDSSLILYFFRKTDLFKLYKILYNEIILNIKCLEICKISKYIYGKAKYIW